MKRTMPLILSIFILLGSTTTVSAQPSAYCSGVCDLEWSPVEENLLGAVNEFGLWLVDMNESKSSPRFFTRENVTNLNFDPTGQYVAVISCPSLAAPTDECNGSISLFDLEEGAWAELEAYNYNISNIKFSPDGRYVAFQNDEIGEWGIQLIDLTTNNTFTVGDQHLTDFIIEYTFDRQSNTIAISNGDIGYQGHTFWGLSVWRLSDQTLQARTDDSILAADLTFTETESNIMFVEYDTKVSVWNYRTNVISPVNKLNETVGDNLHRLSFSASPTHLLAALLDDWHPSNRRLFVWDMLSGEQIFFRDMPEDTFTDLIAMNSTGNYIAYSSTVDELKIVEVWEQTTGATRQVTLSQRGIS